MKHISYVKMSKKQQRVENNKKRVTWDINPVTRKPSHPRAYDRNKEKTYSRKYEYVYSAV